MRATKPGTTSSAPNRPEEGAAPVPDTWLGTRGAQQAASARPAAFNQMMMPSPNGPASSPETSVPPMNAADPAPRTQP